MSLNMFLDSADAQTKSMNEICVVTIRAMKAAINSIDNFQFSARLQGETYKTAKSYMTEVFRPLAQGIIYLCEELIRQNESYPAQFRAQVSNSDVVEQEIKKEIEEIDRLINKLKLNSPMYGTNIYILEAIKKTLEEKLERLYRYNFLTNSIYNPAMEFVQEILQGLSQIKNGKGFNPKTKSFSTDLMELSWVKNIENILYIQKAKDLYGDYIETHLHDYPEDLEKIKYIIKFEEENKKYIEQTNKFLEPLSLKDKIEIKYLLYNAEEPYRTLAIKYLDRVEINLSPIENTGAFYPDNNAIKINIMDDRNNPRGKYYTLFHEIGHAIDYNAGRDYGFDGFFTDYYKINGKSLNDHIYQDARTDIALSIHLFLRSGEYRHLTLEERSQIRSNVLENILKQNKNFNKLTKLEKEIFKEIRYQYWLKLKGPENEAASDVYGGVTNNVITGQYNHNSSYWFDGKKRIQEPNKEAFAEYFGRIMLQEGKIKEEGIKSIEKYLSNSKEFMDALFPEIAKVQKR